MPTDVRFVVTEELLKKSPRYGSAGRPLGTVVRYGLPLLILVLILGVPTAVLLAMELPVAAGAGWAVVLFLFVWGFRRVRIGRTRQREEPAGIEQGVEASDACLRTRGKDSWVRYDWTSVEQVTQADDAVFVAFADQQLIPVPSSAFRSKRDEEAFVALIRQQIDRSRDRDQLSLQSDLDGDTLQQVRFTPAPRTRNPVAEAILVLVYAGLLGGSLYLAQGGPVRQAVFGATSFLLMILGTVAVVARVLTHPSSRHPLPGEVVVTLTTAGAGVFEGSLERFCAWSALGELLASDEALWMMNRSGGVFAQVPKSAFWSEAHLQDFWDTAAGRTKLDAADD